jgi:hypothetical protein
VRSESHGGSKLIIAASARSDHMSMAATARLISARGGMPEKPIRYVRACTLDGSWELLLLHPEMEITVHASHHTASRARATRW